MAVVSDYGTSSAAGSRLEEVDKVLYAMADRSTPILKMFMDLGDKLENTKFEWVDKTLKSLSDSVKTALSSTTTTTLTVYSTTNAPVRYIPNVSLLRFQGSGEIALVTSVITTSTVETVINITRGSRSTTAATYAVNTEIRVIGNPQAESFDVSRDDSQKGVRRYNFTQIFERELKLSGSSQEVRTVGKESTMNTQAAELMPELMKEMQYALFHGNRYASADETTRETGGLRWFAETYGSNVDMGGTKKIDFNLIDDIIETYLTNGGDPNKLVLAVHPRQQRIINELKEARVVGGGMNQSDMAVNRFVNRYDFGSSAQVDIMICNDLFKDEVFFFQKDKVKWRPFRKYERVPLGKTGDNDKEMLLAEYGLQVVNSKELIFRRYNLAYSIA